MDKFRIPGSKPVTETRPLIRLRVQTNARINDVLSQTTLTRGELVDRAINWALDRVEIAYTSCPALAFVDREEEA